VQQLQEAVLANKAWVETAPGQSDPLIYFKGRVMVTYLMDLRGMSYDHELQGHGQ
jgi:hypothetical protein